MLKSPRTKSITIIIIFIPLFIITSAPSLIGEWSQSVIFNWWYLLITSIISIGLLLLIYNVFGVQSLKLRHKLTWHQFLAAGLLAVIFLVGGIVLQNIPPFNSSRLDSDSATKLIQGSLRYPMIVALCITGPICEELTFRGIVQNALRSFMPQTWAIITTSILFSVCHGIEPLKFLLLTAMAIGFSLLNQMFGDLRTSILSHTMYNTAMTFIAYLIM